VPAEGVLRLTPAVAQRSQGGREPLPVLTLWPGAASNEEKPMRMIVALALLLTTPAAAAEMMPRALRGDWCGGFYEPAASPLVWSGDPAYMRAPELPCPDTGLLHVGPRSFMVHELTCHVTRVRNRWDPTIDASTKSVGAVRTTVSVNCGSEGCIWKGQYDLYLRKGSLTWELRQEGKQRCRG
jgi:hypothetical protein